MARNSAKTRPADSTVGVHLIDPHDASQSRSVSQHDRIEVCSRTFTLASGNVSAILTAGERQPVLLVHGNSSCKEIWQHQIAALTQHGHPVLALDLPGHGQSDDAREREHVYSFPGYAGVVAELLQALDWHGVVVVGWSLGGHVGLELYETHPGIDALVIVGAPPARLEPRSLDLAFYRTQKMELAGKKEFDQQDVLDYGSQMLGSEDLISPELHRNIVRTDGNARHFMFRNALFGVGTDQRDAVATNPKPLCVIHGENDPFVRLEYLRTLAFKNLWNDEIVVVSSAGHAPQWQYPQTFNGILLSFLEALR